MVILIAGDTHTEKNYWHKSYWRNIIILTYDFEISLNNFNICITEIFKTINVCPIYQ